MHQSLQSLLTQTQRNHIMKKGPDKKFKPLTHEKKKHESPQSLLKRICRTQVLRVLRVEDTLRTIGFSINRFLEVGKKRRASPFKRDMQRSRNISCKIRRRLPYKNGHIIKCRQLKIFSNKSIDKDIKTMNNQASPVSYLLF